MTATVAPPKSEAQMLPVERVAAILDVSVRTIERMVRRNEFPAPRRLGRRTLWPRLIVERWMLDPASVLPAVAVPTATSAADIRVPAATAVMMTADAHACPANSAPELEDPACAPVADPLPAVPDVPVVAPEVVPVPPSVDLAQEASPAAPVVPVPETAPEAANVALAAHSGLEAGKVEVPPVPDPAARRVVGEILAAVLATRAAPSATPAATVPVPAPVPVVPVVPATVSTVPVTPTLPVRQPVTETSTAPPATVTHPWWTPTTPSRPVLATR